MLVLMLFSMLVFADASQAHAQREAQMMADAKVCKHLLGCAPNARFSGVGRSINPYPKTCLPWEHGSDARKMIADAIVHRDGWYYRSTHWK